jgi:AAA15 family ATPase/GTPase
MFYNNFEINNFRLFKHLKVNNLKRINLIVGKNNVGKTSLLEALCFAKAPFKIVDVFGRPVLCLPIGS